MFTPKQKKIIWTGIVCLAFLTAYVPWKATGSDGPPAGYHFIFAPPNEQIKVDLIRLLIPMVFIVCATGAAAVLSGTRSRKKVGARGDGDDDASAEGRMKEGDRQCQTIERDRQQDREGIADQTGLLEQASSWLTKWWVVLFMCVFFGALGVYCGIIRQSIWPSPDLLKKYRDIEFQQGMSEEEIVSRLGRPDRQVEHFSLPKEVAREWRIDEQSDPGGFNWKVVCYSPIEGAGRSPQMRSQQASVANVYRVNLLFQRGKLYRWTKVVEAAP